MIWYESFIQRYNLNLGGVIQTIIRQFNAHTFNISSR